MPWQGLSRLSTRLVWLQKVCKRGTLQPQEPTKVPIHQQFQEDFIFLVHSLHPLLFSIRPANGSPASTLIQSTSFLDSVPVTLTLEPRDLLGVDGSAGGPSSKGGGGALGSAAKDGRGIRTEEVELRRRPGEGFGFVIASQETPSGSECRLTHTCVS